MGIDSGSTDPGFEYVLVLLVDSLYWMDNIPKTSLNRTNPRWSRDAGTVSSNGENHRILNAYLGYFSLLHDEVSLSDKF